MKYDDINVVQPTQAKTSLLSLINVFTAVHPCRYSHPIPNDLVTYPDIHLYRTWSKEKNCNTSVVFGLSEKRRFQ